MWVAHTRGNKLDHHSPCRSNCTPTSGTASSSCTPAWKRNAHWTSSGPPQQLHMGKPTQPAHSKGVPQNEHSTLDSLHILTMGFWRPSIRVTEVGRSSTCTRHACSTH